MKQYDNNYNEEEIINNLNIEEENSNIIDIDSNYDLIITNLNDIFNKVKKYYNSSSEEIFNYISFLKSFSSQLLEINKINNAFKESQKKIKNIFENNTFENFNNYNLIFIEKLSDFSSQIQRSIIPPFEIYKEKYNSENINIMDNLKKFIEKILSENNKIKQIKKEYKEIKNNYRCEKDEKKRIKIKENMEKQFNLYKDKVETHNSFLIDCRNELNLIIDDFVNKQTIKKQSIEKSIQNYFDLMDNFFSKSNEDIYKLKNKINEINISIKSEQFSKNIKNKIDEIKWEIKKKKYEKKNINNIDNNIDDIKFIDVNETGDKKEKNNQNQKTMKKSSDENSSSTQENSNKNYKMNEFISHLLSKEQLPENEASDFLFILSNNFNIKLYISFCDSIYRYKSGENKKTFLKFLNFHNFTYFSNILDLILENLSNDYADKLQYGHKKYLLLNKIICIGEETMYDNTFLCSLFHNNNKLKNENLWILCMKWMFLDELNKICENYYSKRKKKNFFGEYFLDKVKLNKTETIKEDFITKKGYTKYITHYNNLNDEIKEKICTKEITKIMHEILKNYISHMANYNYPLEGIYKLIEKIYFEYFTNKEPDLMNFYINYSIASTFSVRTMVANIKENTKSEELKIKIKQIKKHNNLADGIKYLSFNLANNKFIILKNVLIFLSNSEKMKLINLNKELYNVLRKEIYLNILLNIKNISFNINEHIQIWKCFLKCNSIYKKLGFVNCDYNSIIKIIETNENFLTSFSRDIKVINLDIPRSPFKQDRDISSKAVNNILLSFLYINNNKEKNKICYYQGMNYIVTFLYEMIHNEEDCLLLFSGLFYSTDYWEIYSNNMEKMRKYLYVVERLVYLYLPEIYSHLRNNKLQLSFFVNPIFISLFTNIYSSLPENDFSFLLEIWDDFILNSWKTIFTDVLAILKQNENKILNLENEALTQYLTNGITNGEMFTIYNYDEFKKEKNKYQPSNQLLEILSKESSLEDQLK